MGRYQGFVDYAKSLPGNNTILDFTNEDAESIPNDGNNVNASSLALSGGYQTDSLGVNFNQGSGVLNNDIAENEVTLRTAIVFFRAEAIDQFGYLFDFGEGTETAGRALSMLITSTGNIRVITNGSSYFYTSSLTIPENQLIVAAVRIDGENSKLFYGELSNIVSESFIPDESPASLNSTTSFASIRSLDNVFLDGDIFSAALYSSALSDSQITNLINSLNIYGELSLQTNLSANRFQQIIALDDSRILTGNATCPVAESDVTIFLLANESTLVEFFAFDTNTENSVLTTGAIVPDPLESLVFNPVSGGGGGDPGTGQLAHIAGTVSIDGTGKEREVIVISDDPAGRQVLGEGMSASDGTFDIQYEDWGGAVIALALDNYGGDWTAETALATGTIIHPTVPNGYVYEVTSAGTTGTEEPTWSISSAVNDGSVTYSPKPFYRPIASGPLQGETLTEPE